MASAQKTKSLRSVGRLQNRRRKPLHTSSSGKDDFNDRLHWCSNNIFPSYDDAAYFLHENTYLEKRWQYIISVEIPLKRRRQQSAIWELITTEKTYLTRLNIIVNLFLTLFNELRDEGDLHDVNKFQIFANVTELLSASEHFWGEYIIHVLRKCREDRKCILPSLLFKSATNMFSFKDMFTCYEEFCLHQEDCVRYVGSLRQPESWEDSETTRKLKGWLAWCEGLSQCDRKSLVNLLCEPHTRLCRYKILLSEILEQTTDKSEVEVLEHILEDCEQFITGINKRLRERTKSKEFMSCLQQFEETEFVDEKGHHIDCCVHISFLRLPIKTYDIPATRFILDECIVKLHYEGTIESNVKLYLFSDVLCLAKVNKVTKKFKIIHPLYFLDHLQFNISQKVIVVSYPDQFGSLVHIFSLELRNLGKLKSWIALAEGAKLCYNNTVAGMGTTLDVFQMNS